jgi:L,D-transpeptidase catalytic domain
MPGKHPGRHTRAAAGHGRRRGPAQLTALAAAGTAVIAAAIWLAVSPVASATAPARTGAPVSRPGGGSTAAVSAAAASPPGALRSPGSSGSALVLSSAARRSCPPAASACADLGDHVTWLQSDGRITYGPVRMEPGAPADPTPRGIFHVAWKAGARYISTSFGVPIPYAVFFAAGGIAFHAGSLTSSSHGCIHLAMPHARYYHDHLPIGAEVAVF